MAFSFVLSHVVMGDAGWLPRWGGWLATSPRVLVSVSEPAALLGLKTPPQGGGWGGFWGGRCWSVQPLPAPSLGLGEAPWGVGGSWFAPSQRVEAGGGGMAQTKAWCWTGHVGFGLFLQKLLAPREGGGSSVAGPGMAPMNHGHGVCGLGLQPQLSHPMAPCNPSQASSAYARPQRGFEVAWSPSSPWAVRMGSPPARGCWQSGGGFSRPLEGAWGESRCGVLHPQRHLHPLA